MNHPSETAPPAPPPHDANAALAALLFETSAVGVALIDRGLRYVRVNPLLAAMNGVPVDAHPGRRLREVISPAAVELIEPVLRRVLDTGEPMVDLPLVLDGPGGHRHFLASYRPVLGAGGAVTGVAAFVAERTPSERALGEAELLARQLFALSPLPTWVYDRATLAFVDVNDAAVRRYGYAREEFLAMTLRDIRPPADVDRLERTAAAPQPTPGSRGVFRHRTRDGELLDVEVFSQDFERAGRPCGIVVVQDVTVQRRADAALREAVAAERAARAATEAERERLNAVVRQLPAPVSVMEGRELRFRALSEAYHRIVGGRDVVGRPIREALPELSGGEGGADFFALLEGVYDSGVPVVRTGERAHWDDNADGVPEEHIVDLVYAPLFGPAADGGAPPVEGVMALVLDVTARARAEAALRESEARFRNMADAAPVMLWVTDAEGACTFLNRQWLDFTGQRLATGLGYGWLDAVHPDDAEAAGRAFRDANAARLPFRVEYRLRRHDGEYRWCVDAAAPRRDARGAYLGYVGSVVDVHERRVGEQRLLALFDQAPVFIAVMRGPDHVYERVNAAHGRYAGAHRQLIGRPAREAFPEMADQGFIERLDGVLATGEPFAGTAVPVRLARTPGGPLEERYVDFVYAPLTEPDGTRSGVAVIGSDVTERVRAERARAVAREAADLEQRRLAAVLAALPVGVILVEAPSGRVVYFNDAARRIWGTEPADGGTGEGFAWRGFHVERGRPADRPVAPDEWPVARALRTGAPVLDVLAAPARADGVGPVASISAVPIHDGAGQVVGAAAVLVDVDAQQRARRALETARTAAEAANRAKSEFLAVMSHELRTPLNAIQGYAELMELGIHGPVSPAQQEALRRIQASQRHLLGLVNGVLNYARVETGNVHYAIADVPVDAVLATCEALVAPQAGAKGVALALEAEGPGALAVRADPEKVQQILLNLLTNALKFTDPGGRVALRARPRDGAVCVEVADTGVGIARDQLERIFEPFVQVDQRLTRAHEGVGLGLAISRDLARGMGGDLTAESAPGAGSTFTLVLPRA